MGGTCSLLLMSSSSLLGRFVNRKIFIVLVAELGHARVIKEAIRQRFYS